jgi:hypothetical protein
MQYLVQTEAPTIGKPDRNGLRDVTLTFAHFTTDGKGRMKVKRLVTETFRSARPNSEIRRTFKVGDRRPA